MTVTAYIKSLIFDNYGVVDEMWSTAPFMYAWVFNNWTARGIVMQVAIGCWAVRLSYNLFRKGGFHGLEDYRWRSIKDSIDNKCLWVIFHIFFWAVF